MNELKVGQKVYVKPIGNAARCDSKIKEEVISEVKRKYFKLEGWYRTRFFIDGLYEDCGQYISNHQCYLSMQEIEDEKEHTKLMREMNETFDYLRGRRNITLEQLRKIKKILEPETPEE